MDAARGCQDEPHVCGGPNARGRSTATHTHPHSQKGKDMEKRSPPHSAFKKAHAEAPPSTSYRKTAMRTAHPQPQQEERGASKSTTVLYLPLPRRNSVTPHSWSWRWRPTLTVRHGAHHPLPSERTHQGAQSPSHHRNGEHKRSSSRTIDASSRKEKVMRECQLHG
ncbi:hypothetical protein TcCL_NonESM04852 [Trypanosoma cruzi]|nr:hypothetical protein TcCL_NonESM04852 [Trypanosoma cruzi]